MKAKIAILNGSPYSVDSHARLLCKTLTLCASLGIALTGVAETLPPLPEGEDCFTIATFGDTQAYANNGDGTVSNPSFKSRVDWLSNRENIIAQNILFVSHLGDIVNSRTVAAEWTFADTQMTRLDGVVPYAICPGNHDITGSGVSKEFQQCFPASRYSGNAWYGGSFLGIGTEGVFDNNSNSYQLFDWMGQGYILFHLQCNAGKAVLDWVNELLSGTYADRRAIVVTHMYLGMVLEDAKGQSASVDQRFVRRMRWGKVSANGSMNPTESWNYCFRKHKNLVLILSGDQSEALACHRTAVGIHGNIVHEIVTDYPHADNSDWIRLYRFFPKSGKIDVYTYSPQADALCTSAGYCTEERFHRFTMELGGEGATVGDVLVRQEWPRNNRIRVDFTLFNPDERTYDITVSATAGEAPVDVPSSAVSGQTAGLQGGGYTLFVDVTKLALPAGGADDFRVMLTPSPSAAADDPDSEVLYRIVSLRGDKTVRDLTRRDIRSGLWGTYVSTKEEYNDWTHGAVENDVLIWTGVTNDIYKTDYIVFRKIPAGTFDFTDKGIPTEISKPYWMSVFEYTQGQYARVRETVVGGPVVYDDYYRESWFSNGVVAAKRPVDWVSWTDIVGAGYAEWPQEITASGLSGSKLVGKFRTATGMSEATLPTWAQWERACRGDVTTEMFNGRDYNIGAAVEMLDSIARWKGNAGWTPVWNEEGRKYDYIGAEPDRTCTDEAGTAPVGSYAPNTWGLYDMEGNVTEWVLDRESTSEGMAALAEAAGGTLRDPVGNPEGNSSQRMICGSCWENGVSLHKIVNMGSCGYSKRSNSTNGGRLGCRLMMPASDVVPSDETEVSAPVTVCSRPDEVQRWRTVKSGEMLTMPFLWPDGAVRVEVTVVDSQETEVASVAADRVLLAKQGEVSVAFPEVSVPTDERVYDFRVKFLASNGGGVIAERNVRLGLVLGFGGRTGARVRTRSSGWSKAEAVNVLSVQPGEGPLSVDGQKLETGLGGAAGWCEWRPEAEKRYEIRYGDGSKATVRFGETGLVVIVK